mgnify:FL=1|nr:MAG TPA: IrrE N-terminal-like domain [Caudoviricetes sp.]DAV22419.1 MAG TPA: IrrE N-terminal-like domain [Caudoviricetes sp.]
MLLLVVNIIYCDLPHVNAVSEPSEDIDTHNIYVNKNLPHDKMKREIKHELSHIINDDFYIDHHVNLVEEMVRRSTTTIEETIDFYHHVL